MLQGRLEGHVGGRCCWPGEMWEGGGHVILGEGNSPGTVLPVERKLDLAACSAPNPDELGAH